MNLPDVNEVTAEAAKQAIWDDAAQAQSTAGPKYGSAGVETKDFEGCFVPAQDSTELWVFSDDGVDVYITDYSLPDPGPVRYLNRKDQPQHLPAWQNESLWKVGFDFDSNKVYGVRVEYSNIIYHGVTDIDGCTLFATHGGGTVLKVDLDHDLWWFNGENPGGGYHITSTLTVTPVTTGTFKWDVIAGATKVDLNNGGADADSITATDDNTVTVKSTAASAAAASVTKDVTVQLTYNGTAVCTYDLAVFAPHTLTDLTNIDHDYSALPTPPYPDNPGYWCEIKYKIRDQFNQVLPYNVPWNEDFNKDGLNAVTGVSDYPGGDNWGWGPECGWTVPPSAAIDNLARPNPPCSTPPAQNVGSGTVKVDHEIGGWYIGSATIGKGVLVKDNCKWQFYQDHARHE